MKKNGIRWTVGLLLWLCSPYVLHAQPPEAPQGPDTPQGLEAVSPGPGGPENAEQLEPEPSMYADGSACSDQSSFGQCDAGSSTRFRRFFKGPSRLAIWWNERAKPCLQYSHWGYPEYFEETPNGARVRECQVAQICNGWASRLMLYHYDFCEDSSTLNLHGQRRLHELAAAFPIWMHHALVIETTPGNPHLDLQRRDHIAALLANGGTPAQVEVGYPPNVSPFGDETRVVGGKFLNAVSRSGLRSGGGSGGSSGGSSGTRSSSGR